MQGKGKPSICIDCEKSCGLCSWSSRLIPVVGWTAKPVKKLVSIDTLVDSFQVDECPLFTPADREEEINQRPWTPQEKAQLKSMMRQRCRRKDIAVVLNRSLSSVNSKITELRRKESKV